MNPLSDISHEKHRIYEYPDGKQIRVCLPKTLLEKEDYSNPAILVHDISCKDGSRTVVYGPWRAVFTIPLTKEVELI